MTRRSGGNREAEHHVPNLIIPFVSGIAGLFAFGYAGQANLHWSVLMLGSMLVVFGFLMVMSILNVFVTESYPMWNGPVLVNVSSLRIIIAFFLSSQATTWVMNMGLLTTMSIYAVIMIVLALGIPGLFFYGKRMRQWTAGRVQNMESKPSKKKMMLDDDSASERSFR